MRRRELLLAAAGLLGAPAAAQAAPTEGTVVLGLMWHEQRAKRAYAAAIEAGGAGVYATIHAQESDHADALATELAAIGLGRPLTHALEGASAMLARDPSRANAIKLEDELVHAYAKSLPLLQDAKIAMTAATILASHAQHRLILGSKAS